MAFNESLKSSIVGKDSQKKQRREVAVESVGQHSLSHILAEITLISEEQAKTMQEL